MCSEVDPLAAAVIRICRQIFRRRKSAESLWLTPFSAKFFTAENPPKILWHSTTMRRETQPYLLYLRQLLFHNFRLMRWTEVLKLPANVTYTGMWKYTISLYNTQQCSCVGMKNWDRHWVYFSLLVCTCCMKYNYTQGKFFCIINFSWISAEFFNVSRILAEF